MARPQTPGTGVAVMAATTWCGVTTAVARSIAGTSSHAPMAPLPDVGGVPDTPLAARCGITRRPSSAPRDQIPRGVRPAERDRAMPPQTAGGCTPEGQPARIAPVHMDSPVNSDGAAATTEVRSVRGYGLKSRSMRK